VTVSFSRRTLLHEISYLQLFTFRKILKNQHDQRVCSIYCPLISLILLVLYDTVSTADIFNIMQIKYNGMINKSTLKWWNMLIPKSIIFVPYTSGFSVYVDCTLKQIFVTDMFVLCVGM
jgi:hypothetical protein